MDSDRFAIAYETVWVKCRVAKSRKPDEALVEIDANDTVERPVFYVDVSLVRPEQLPEDFSQVEGEVSSMLLEAQNGTAIIEVPGDPLTYGPKVFVSRNLISS